MSLKKRKIRRMFEKLHFVPKDTKERYYYYYYDNKLILRSGLPKGEGDIKKGTASAIKNELKLSRQQFVDAYNCPFSHEDFLKRLKEKNLLP